MVDFEGDKDIINNEHKCKSGGRNKEIKCGF